MEPTNMPDKHTDADTVVSGRVHGGHNAAANEHMPRSVWQPRVVRRLADYIRQLREVDDEPNQRPVASQPSQPTQSQQSGQPHVCTRNPHRTCNCDAGACADDSATYRYARGPFRAVFLDKHGRVLSPEPNRLGNFNCPVDNRACSKDVCPVWCGESSGAGAEIDADRGNASTTINR
jgi:hypothetical protein